ncbi:hypothetical protein M9H77_34057 [Catharanthus roseus]|uniref:Uncharacterized protein n=1 Tax=Catharanthus roseus TaxID=4058 RepID=A0ACB9ZK53_CATRO|nr:hypothetical protein M9H77_34057 [Catharanthus roseus]
MQGETAMSITKVKKKLPVTKLKGFTLEFKRELRSRKGYEDLNLRPPPPGQQQAFQAHVLPIFFLLFQPNFSFPLQHNDVNWPQPWNRLSLTGSRDARARERNRERGLPVTSVMAEAISEGIIPDHPLAYLRRLDAVLSLLGDHLHFW